MYKAVFIRNAQIIWNNKKIFTGWTGVGLASAGIREARVLKLL